jgi:SET domain-containing protein
MFKAIRALMSDDATRSEFLRFVPHTLDPNLMSRAELERLLESGDTNKANEFMRQLDPTFARLLCGKYMRNAFHVHKDNRPCACVLTKGNIFNHSCDPNVQFSFDFSENMMVFKAIKNIKKGEECFDNYVDPKLPIKKRRSALLQRYGFLCECTKCSPSQAF